MKRFLSISLTVFFTVIALCFQAPAFAQDDDFPEYDRLEMPRQGKDIRLIFVPEIGEEDVVTTLAWDGTRFTVKLPTK